MSPFPPGKLLFPPPFFFYLVPFPSSRAADLSRAILVFFQLLLVFRTGRPPGSLCGPRSRTSVPSPTSFLTPKSESPRKTRAPPHPLFLCWVGGFTTFPCWSVFDLSRSLGGSIWSGIRTRLSSAWEDYFPLPSTSYVPSHRMSYGFFL